MRRCASLLLVLLVGCPSSGDPPADDPPEREAPMAWSVIFNTSYEVDHGDGVTRETGSSALHVSRAGVELVASGWTEEGGDSAETKTPQPAFAEERLAKIEALLPKLDALAEAGDPAFGLRYSLSPYVDDEGGHWQGLTVQTTTRTISIALEQGRQVPYPPPAVIELYELITGGPAPEAWK